ncbi:zinc finger protein 107-like isoform X1 [Pararge aegeria]|nr:zinc finger protein 107-like isoform X1 [Pararge aegeria]
MASINSKKNRGPIVDPALCRCCHSIKKCRLLTSEYEFMDSKEVYSVMLIDVFGLLLSHLDGDNTDCCICATCVSRLREASAFRKQVLQSEQMFLEARHVSDSETDTEKPLVTKATAVISTNFKSLKRTRNIHISDKKQPSIASKIQRLQKKPPADRTQLKTPKATLEQNRMALINTVKIVTYSYVCPFYNKISFYYCFYCMDQFTSPVELREHTLKHEPKLFKQMMEHKKKPKVDITRIDCRLCEEKIDDVDTFKKHITSEHKKILYPVTNEFLKFRLTAGNMNCTECDEAFSLFDSLNKHMLEHFVTHTCDECGAKFIELSLLRSHIRNTHKKVDAVYPCEICGKNLKSKYSRGLHVATVHEKKPTINCYKCDAAFLSHALRNRHLIEVHGDKRTFPCKLCDKVYNRRKTMMEHHRRSHLKVFNHQCELCAQMFYVPSALKEHMAIHRGERNFKCDECGKSYPGLKSLQCHKKSHKRKLVRRSC